MNELQQNYPSPGRIIALMLVGFGFLALGISFFMLQRDVASYTSTTEFSTIPAEVDFPAPELTLPTLNGQEASLSDYLGSVVLVNLWATWCPPCTEEMPTLKAFYEEYHSQGFELIAIDQGETLEVVVPFVKEFALPFPVWLDTGSQASLAFNTMNLPSSYVIDRNGQVRLMWIGGISKRNLEKYVPEIIKD